MSDIVYKGDIVKNLCEQIDGKKEVAPSSSFDINLIHRCSRQQILRSRSSATRKNVNKVFHENAIKNKWTEILRACKKVRIVENKPMLADTNCNITVIADVVIEFKDNIYIVNVVSVDSQIFSKVKDNGPRRKDVITMQAYIWLSELEKGIIIYEDISNQQYDVFLVRKDILMINAIETKLKKLTSFQISGVIPDVPDDINKIECESCEHKQTCKKQLGD